jgi:hypothetical protein
LIANHPDARNAVFALLHSPPASHGINRTSWRQADLLRLLREQGNAMSKGCLAAIIKSSGFSWRRARKVLTSNDPEYRAKMDRIHSILAGLGPEDRFFSIDEYGPFAIKMQSGRKLVGPGECPVVPQRQKSRGSLIVSAALELSRNQVTHFYSEGKNTGEMIRLLETLMAQYTDCRKLYLSWDGASWHASKRFQERVKEVNDENYRLSHQSPTIELAPLPSGAQFANVIESVFSGMARAIIHNSNYQSVEEAKVAIDQHFAERNAYFQEHPQRAGRTIWGKEGVASDFSEGHNCKDSKYR